MWRRRLCLLSGLAQPSPRPLVYSHPLSASVVPLARTLAPASVAASAVTSPWIPNGIFRSSFSGMAMRSSSTGSLLRLNDLRDDKGARQRKKRKGRGIGSGKGKTAGRGHKGQKARGTMKFGFEGGQTPLRRRLPRRGFKNPFSRSFQPVGLGKIAKLINAGEIDSLELITMKTLKDIGAIEVSRVTARAKGAVEAAGGSVRKVYYNKLGFKALLKPEWFEKKGRLLPRPARPPPKQRDRVDSIGRLPAPTKPIPFTDEEKQAAAAKVAA